MLDMQTSHGCPKCKVECTIFQYYSLIFVCMHDIMISLCIELYISLKLCRHAIAAWFCASFANESHFQDRRNWKQVVNVPRCNHILGPKSDDKQNFFWSLEDFSSKISKKSCSLTASCKIISFKFVLRFWMVLLPRERGTVWKWSGIFFSLHLAQCIDIKARHISR